MVNRIDRPFGSYEQSLQDLCRLGLALASGVIAFATLLARTFRLLILSAPALQQPASPFEPSLPPDRCYQTLEPHGRTHARLVGPPRPDHARRSEGWKTDAEEHE
jgi:hypothetical protein